MFDLIVIVLVGILLLFAVYTAFQFQGKFPKRTADDVAPFLRPAEPHEPVLDERLDVRGRQPSRLHRLRDYGGAR